MKKRAAPLLSGLFLLLLSGFALPLTFQGGVRETAHGWEGERSPRGEYILETFRRDEGETAMASFRVLGLDGTEIYACPGCWRTMDLKSIGWTGESYDIQVISGDVGTVTYFHSGDGWGTEEPSPTPGPFTDPTCYPMPEVSWTGAEWERLQTLAGEEAEEVFHFCRVEDAGAVGELVQYYQWLGGEAYEDGGWRTELWYTPREGAAPQRYPVDNVTNGGLAEEERLLFADVNYDGRPELLVGKGRFGNRGYLFYACYLQREEGLSLCKSFSEIKNPCLDRDKKAVLSPWTMSGACHVWSFYEFRDQGFLETKRLTASFFPDQGGLELWTEEVLRDGQWAAARQWRWQGEENSYSQLEDLFFNETNDWAIHSDRWSYL